MADIIKSEIFKCWKSIYFRICLVGGSLVIAVMMYFLPEVAGIVGFHINTCEDLSKIMPFVLTGACVMLMIFFPVFTDIFKYNTLKNNPRSIPYMTTAKFFTVILFCMIYAVVFLAAFTVTYFRLAQPGESISLLIKNYISFLAAIPNYAAVIALIQLLTIVSKNEIVAAIIYYYSFAQLFTIKLMVANSMPEDIVLLRHLTPIGEFYNLGDLQCSAVHIALSLAIGFIYTITIHIITRKTFMKRVEV